LVSARPPPLFSSPAAAHLLPPSLAQSAIATLVRFLYYRTCPIRPSLADRWAHPVSEPGVVIRTCPFCKTCLIQPLRPQAIARTLSPFGLSSLGVFAKRHLFFEFAQSGNDAFSISRYCHVGPARQFHPSPRAGRPQSRRHLWSILDHQNLTHNLATMSSPISPLPPSIPALTRKINPLESASIAINAIAITTALEPLPRPYKRSLTFPVHSTPLH
jgi:hypothetical protein